MVIQEQGMFGLIDFTLRNLATPELYPNPQIVAHRRRRRITKTAVDVNRTCIAHDQFPFFALASSSSSLNASSCAVPSWSRRSRSSATNVCTRG